MTSGVGGLTQDHVTPPPMWEQVWWTWTALIVATQPPPQGKTNKNKTKEKRVVDFTSTQLFIVIGIVYDCGVFHMKWC